MARSRKRGGGGKSPANSAPVMMDGLRPVGPSRITFRPGVTTIGGKVLSPNATINGKPISSNSGAVGGRGDGGAAKRVASFTDRRAEALSDRSDAAQRAEEARARHIGGMDANPANIRRANDYAASQVAASRAPRSDAGIGYVVDAVKASKVAQRIAPPGPPSAGQPSQRELQPVNPNRQPRKGYN